MTELEARDLAFGHVRAAALLFPLDPVTQLIWPDRPGNLPVAKPWIKSWFVPDDRQQVAFGGRGKRRFETTGILTLMCYAPVGDGEKTVIQLAQHMVNELEKVRSDQMWYANIRAVHAPNEGSFNRRDVKVHFRFDQHN